jgi:ABC-type nitrate/sulfonate/bicarbonate transport system substrate-binding protein
MTHLRYRQRHRWQEGRARWTLLALITILTAAGGLLLQQCARPRAVIRYGITPYQDTSLPVVAEGMGWYKADGLNVTFVPLAWGDLMLALASGSVDVSIYTINAFEPAYTSAASSGTKPVFYCPLYVFEGTAIMVHANSGLRPLKLQPGESVADRNRQVAETAAQLRGKRIAVTQGTEYEQIVLTVLGLAGLDPRKDVTLIHATPEDALAAFLSGNIDAFGAGLTERTEARRHGGMELLTAADIGQPSLDGLVTTEKFARDHPDELDQLIRIWYRTIGFMDTNLTGNSHFVLDYLAGKASTRYTPEQYAIAWTFNVYPKTAFEAFDLFENPSSQYYWETAWKQTNDFLLGQHKISTPVPESAYLGTTVLTRLKSK